MSTKDEQDAQYKRAWESIKPEMMLFFDALKSAMKGRIGLDPVHAAAQMGGDEEFKFSMDWRADGNDESLAGIDLVLADSMVRDGEFSGFNVMVELQGYGGAFLGAYIPNNLTDQCFTEDVEELKSRLIGDLIPNATEFAEVLCERIRKQQALGVRAPEAARE